MSDTNKFRDRHLGPSVPNTPEPPCTGSELCARCDHAKEVHGVSGCQYREIGDVFIYPCNCFAYAPPAFSLKPSCTEREERDGLRALELIAQSAHDLADVLYRKTLTAEGDEAERFGNEITLGIIPSLRTELAAARAEGLAAAGAALDAAQAAHDAKVRLDEAEFWYERAIHYDNKPMHSVVSCLACQRIESLRALRRAIPEEKP